jgi:prefoldin subunit 5
MAHMNSNVEVLAEYIANLIVQNKEMSKRIETLEAAISNVQSTLDSLKHEVCGTIPYSLG